MRFLKDSHTARLKQKHATALREALADYLDLRGYATTDQTAGDEAASVGEGSNGVGGKADSAGTEPRSAKGKRGKRKPGPKGPRYDSAKDKRIYDGWKTSGETTIEKRRT